MLDIGASLGLNKDEQGRGPSSAAARVALGFPATRSQPTRQAGEARALKGIVIKGTWRLMGSSFGPICGDKGDGGCSDAPEVMA